MCSTTISSGFDDFQLFAKHYFYAYSTEHTFDSGSNTSSIARHHHRQWAYAHRGYMPGCRSCIGAASRSCVWPARSCAGGSPWELHMGAAPVAAVKFCGSYKFVRAASNRCPAAANVWELRWSCVGAGSRARERTTAAEI